jgi:mycothiol synthase
VTQTTVLPKGYSIRAQREEDFTPLADFLIRWDLRMGGYSDFSEEDLSELDRHPRFDPAKDSCLVSVGDEIVGYVRLWEEDPRAVIESFGAVDPDHTGKGIGTLLLDFIERRAEERLLEAGGQAIAVRAFVDVNDELATPLFLNAEYEDVRRHHTMAIPLDGVIPDVTEPAGVDIRTGSLDEARLVHSLVEDVFAEHWGHVPMPYEEWSEMVLKRGDIDPTLWFIAEVDSEPVAILLACVEPTRGWVSDLGVRTKWRRRGIARALLHRSFVEFQNRGLGEAALGVDGGNETGAVALYESVGMRPVKAYVTYERVFSAQ